MENEERLRKLQLERQKIDDEIRLIKHSGRLCDFVSEKPIEYIRIKHKMPEYSHGHGDIWRHIVDISKNLFVSREPITGDTSLVMREKCLFKEMTTEEMKAAGALAGNLISVYNEHFMKYNPTVNVDGNIKKVIDYE